MPPKKDSAVRNYLIEAAAVGCPYDQTHNFIEYGYCPYPWANAFHAACRAADLPGGPVMIACGGARGPGKSHAIMAQIALDDCQRMPGLKVLFLRKVSTSAVESFDDVVRKVLVRVPHKQTENTVEFGNGSRILVGGYYNDKEIDKYLGIEYDVIVIEESTQLTGEKIEKIRGSLRTSKRNWRARLYETTNPDGVGHLRFKNTYVIPYRLKQEIKTRFFPANVRDNPRATPEYIEFLESLTGPLRKAWLDGDWDAFEGMAFPEFSRQTHVCQPFQIPDYWAKWRAVDYGTTNPFAAGWIMKDPDIGRLFVYREVYFKGMTDTQQARLIADNTSPNELITVTYADPSMWAQKSALGIFTTTADEYAREGVLITKANNDRLQGVRNVHRALGMLPDGKPGVMIFNTVTHLIEQLESLVTNKEKGNPEDVDTEQEDHAYDWFRYGLTNVFQQPRKQEKQTKQALARVSYL